MRDLDVLRDLCDRVVAELDGDGCLLSRVIGDLLVLVAEDESLRATRIARNYLVSDYPQTMRVLEERVALALTVDDEDADATETAILEELGFWSLLMLPLEIDGEVWGLVEVYGRAGRAFDDADAARALGVVREASARLAASA